MLRRKLYGYFTKTKKDHIVLVGCIYRLSLKLGSRDLYFLLMDISTGGNLETMFFLYSRFILLSYSKYIVGVGVILGLWYVQYV